MIIKYLLLFILMVFPFNALAVIAQLPRTGQNKCYDTDGFELSCTGTGQDGDINAGIKWLSPRFTDNGNQTVTDSLTGLTWTKDANLMKNRDPSFDTIGTLGDGKVYLFFALEYIKKLNNEHYQGFNDWRLPNINELESLLNRQQSNNSEWLNSQGFMNCQAGLYWTSTTNAVDTTYVMTVDMSNGDVAEHLRTMSQTVWPVRGGVSQNGTSSIDLPTTRQSVCYRNSSVDDLASLYPAGAITCAGSGQDGELQVGISWPIPRFVDNGDQTISDNLTGLTWSKRADGPYVYLCDSFLTATWQTAVNSVKCLNQKNYLNKNDWRLPNVKELETLVNRSQSNIGGWLESQGFMNVFDNIYWTSTSNISSPSKALAVSLYSGKVTTYFKTDSHYVWLVRGGELPIAGTCGSYHNQILPNKPTINLCATGTPSSVTDTVPWNWTCNSLNDGASANCKAYATIQHTTLLNNDFNGVTPPALPSGWSSNGIAFWMTNSGTRYPAGFAAHSPENLIFFNSYSTLSGNTASLISPTFSLANVTDANLTFWMYRDTGFSTAPDLINVYINNFPTLSGATILGTLNRSTTRIPTVTKVGWYQYSFTIPEILFNTTNYIIIEGVGGYGNDIHIDDIKVDAFLKIAPIDGICGISKNATFATLPTINLCSIGAESAVVNNGSWIWLCGGQYGGINATCSAKIQQYQLAVNIVGPDNNTVTNLATSAACISGHTCPVENINSGTQIVLSKTETIGSLFSKWEGACTDNSSCSFTMNGPKNVTATFTAAPRVKVQSKDYLDIQSAYDATTTVDQALIKLLEGSLQGDFISGKNISVTLGGGYNAKYDEISSDTTINGKIILKSGATIMDRIKIR